MPNFQTYSCLALVLLGFVPAGSGYAAPASMAYYEGRASLASLKAEQARLQQIVSDSFAIDATGRVTGQVAQPVRAIARAHGMQIFAAVSNFGPHGFSEAVAHAILTDPTAQAKAITAMRALGGQLHLAGINVDFENVNHRDRAAYTGFVQNLAASLHPAGLLVVLSVPAALEDNPNDSWTGAFDYAALGKLTDIFQLMTYDENGPWGAPGPVAGLDWVTASLTYTLSAMPASKISLGLPAYGYDWNLTAKTGTQIGEASIPALIARTGATPQWDAKTASPWFTYTAADSANHVVWYENPESTTLKAALANGNSLIGVSVYALGMEDTAYWQAVDAGLRPGALPQRDRLKEARPGAAPLDPAGAVRPQTP